MPDDEKRDRGRGSSDSEDDRSRRRRKDRKRRKKRSRSRERRRRKRSRRKYSSSESDSDDKPRKRGNWDKAPTTLTTPAAGGGFGMAPTGMGVAPAPLAGLGGIALGLNPMLMQANQHAQRQARRVYLGNVTEVIQEKELVEFLNNKIKGVSERIAPPTQDPVLSISINREKAYAFIEFHSDQDADIAVCMDGILFKGCLPLKIRRPKDYVPPNDGKKRNFHVPGIVSTQVEDGPDKIFIGNLPPGLTEMEVKEFLKAYGELKAFHMVKDVNTGMPKGYAFFTYVNSAVVDDACKGLNGIELGDKKLVCQRANIGAKPHPNLAGLIPGLMGGGLLSMGLPGIPTGQLPGMPPGLGAAAAALVMQQAPAQAIKATRILVMQNMVQPDDIKDEEEYKDIVEDIREECERFGKVKDIVVPRPSANNPAGVVKGLGKVFVEFIDAEDAQKAERAICGRKFAERTVLTRFLSETDFQSRNLDA